MMVAYSRKMEIAASIRMCGAGWPPIAAKPWLRTSEFPGSRLPSTTIARMLPRRFYVMAQSFVRFIVKRASIEFALWSPRYVLSVVLEGWGIGDGGGYLPGRAGGNETT